MSGDDEKLFRELCKDIATIKEHLNNLPCQAHTEKLSRLRTFQLLLTGGFSVVMLVFGSEALKSLASFLTQGGK